MKTFIVLSAISVAVLCNVAEVLFPRYDEDHNRCLDSTEWERLWYHFDTNDDGNVTLMEFDTVWHSEDFDEKERAPRFFMELDRVTDDVLNSVDFAHIFRIFDEDGSGCITSHEYKFVWKALFDN